MVLTIMKMLKTEDKAIHTEEVNCMNSLTYIANCFFTSIPCTIRQNSLLSTRTKPTTVFAMLFERT